MSPDRRKGENLICLEACLKKPNRLSSLFLNVGGPLGVEADATMKHLSSCLVTRWNHHYFQTHVYIHSRITITLLCATYHCIRGTQVPTCSIRIQRPQWQDGTGLNLYQQVTQENKRQQLPVLFNLDCVHKFVVFF